MKRRAAAFAALTVGAAMLAGCTTQGDVGNRNIVEQRVLKDGNGNPVIDRRFANDRLNEQNRLFGRQLNSNNLIGSHQNYRMEASQDIAKRIREAEGLGDVYVILTDRNAYVAVSRQAAAGKSGNDELYGWPSSQTASRAGLENKSPATSGTGANAKSGAGSKSGGTLEERIARHVKEMAPQIERVYVSEEPDFVNRMGEYIRTASRGEPIQGFIAQFNAMVERLFPAESGIRISRTGSKSIYD